MDEVTDQREADQDQRQRDEQQGTLASEQRPQRQRDDGQVHCATR